MYCRDPRATFGIQVHVLLSQRACLVVRCHFGKTWSHLPSSSNCVIMISNEAFGRRTGQLSANSRSCSRSQPLHYLEPMRFPQSSGALLAAMATAGRQKGAMVAQPTILGAISGDIVGSVYENHPTKDPHFQPLFHAEARPTDDTILTVATMHALLEKDTDAYPYADLYREYGRRYPNAGYGASFIRWFQRDASGPYNSWGNGSAMRVSPIGWAFDDRDTVLKEAKRSAEVTHNHVEGIKGAQATALAVYLARTGTTKTEIREDIEKTFGYDLSSKTLDEIRPSYSFDVSCHGSVPESIICFLEGESCEHAIRLAVSLGGDSDTQACIAGSIAEAFYGPTEGEIASQVKAALPAELLSVVDQFSLQVLSAREMKDE